VPGDVGTFGLVAAAALRKPLMVRYCGNWLAPRTAAEHFWIRTMERIGGGRNVMFATGGGDAAPSALNPAVEWIFSTSLAMDDFGAQPKSRRPDEPARLVIACRQQARKGAAQVIRVLPLLPGATLEVAGDGEALPSLRALAAEMKLSDRVTFHGKLGRRAVLDLLARSTLFCYPTSSSEGFPKVVLEALASGLPVVTTRVSVLPHLIGSECGELLDDTEPQSVAAAVRRCLEPERYRTCSANAIATARRYSLERWRDTIASRLESAWGRLSEKAI
jgi:glycosyltransferase involved in cell wall biosynthesis